MQPDKANITRPLDTQSGQNRDGNGRRRADVGGLLRRSPSLRLSWSLGLTVSDIYRQFSQFGAMVCWSQLSLLMGANVTSISNSNSVLSHWQLEIGHAGNIYTAEIENYDKSRLFPLENWWLNIYQHITGLGTTEKRDLCLTFPGRIQRGGKPLEICHMSSPCLAKIRNDCVACGGSQQKGCKMASQNFMATDSMKEHSNLSCTYERGSEVMKMMPGLWTLVLISQLGRYTSQQIRVVTEDQYPLYLPW